MKGPTRTIHRLLIRRWPGPLAAVLALLLITAPAYAHWADLAVAEIVVHGASAEMTLSFPTGLVAPFDDNRDGRLSGQEIEAHRRALEEVLGDAITITDGRDRGTLSVQPVAGPGLVSQRERSDGVPGTHTTLLLRYTWPRPLQALTVHYGLFLPGVATASCLATVVENGRTRTFVFTPENRNLSITFSGTSLWAQARGFISLGVEHILTGYDHILFLLSLLALGGGLRYLVKVTSAFTLAHSITLSLAVFNLVALPGRWVESAIALSIVYVAAENVWRRERALQNRWLVTFGFGLVHGLGFASILRALAIERGALALSLAGFNLGVELGQIAIVTAAFLALRAMRIWPWEVTVRRLVSAGAGAAGLIWFVQRAILP